MALRPLESENQDFDPLVDSIRGARCVLLELGISSECIQQIEEDAFCELLRRLPNFARMVVLMSSLPAIAQRAKATCLKQGLPQEDAEEQSSELVKKILAALFGRWPTGNVGAWVSSIQSNIRCDFLRAKEKEARCLGIRNDQFVLDECEAESEYVELNRLLETSPPILWAIAERCLNGECVESIVQEMAISEEQLARLQPLVGPGGKSSRSRKRRRRL